MLIPLACLAFFGLKPSHKQLNGPTKHHRRLDRQSWSGNHYKNTSCISKDMKYCAINKYVCTLMKLSLLAGWSPTGNIEIFTPHKPVHSALLRSRRYKSKTFTRTVLADRIELLPKITSIVLGKQMPTEAFGLFAEARAL